MNLKMLVGLIVSLLIVDFALALEQPEYTVTEDYDEWEVRHYKPYIAAKTRVEGSLFSTYKSF